MRALVGFWNLRAVASGRWMDGWIGGLRLWRCKMTISFTCDRDHVSGGNRGGRKGGGEVM